MTTNIPEERWGVHNTHCCVIHGCKYGDRDCPVVLSISKQAYACEECEEDSYRGDDNHFNVFTIDTSLGNTVSHWSDGLTMYINKNGVTIKLNKNEIRELIKTLPRTFGGSY